jgi:hypothetical protein
MIFVVTTLTDIDHCIIMSSKGKDKGFDERTVGWFKNFEDADTNVKLNCGDIHEGNFDYVVIEEVAEGFYSGASAKKTWYGWNTEFKQYEKIKEPPQWNNITAIGIG